MRRTATTAPRASQPLRECCVLAARLAVGGALLLGGMAGLLSASSADLLAAMRAYAVVPAWSAWWLAVALPWVEAVLGLAVLVGLSQSFSLRVAAGLLTLFWLVISQALLRRLPITDCGCFGTLASFTPQQMWMVDLALAGLAWWLVARHTETVSADRWL